MDINKRNLVLNTIYFLLFAAIVLLLVRVQQNNISIESSSASGFGANATRSVYIQAAESFLNTRCEDIFSNNYKNNSNFPELTKYGLDKEVIRRKYYDNVPLHCNYKFPNGKEITLMLHSYNKDSIIDSARDVLYARMNGTTLADSFDSGRIGIMDYFFGYDKFDRSTCRANLFHPLNDFEMASIFYKGFNCDEIYNLNKEITSIYGNYIFYTMEYIYALSGTATEQLLYTFSSTEYLDGLTFYGN